MTTKITITGTEGKWEFKDWKIINHMLTPCPHPSFKEHKGRLVCMQCGAPPSREPIEIK